MNTDLIRKKLHEYIDTASDKKVQAFFTIIEGDLDNVYDSRLNDPDFVAEMDRRYNKYLKDPSKAKTWDEVKDLARQKLNLPKNEL